MKLAVLSDIHAGLGEDNARLRSLQTAAVKHAASYINDQSIDTLILNGDTTDHLLNSLSSATNREIALEVLAPLVSIIKQKRNEMKTVVLSGNTDWPVADPDTAKKESFFEYTGLSAEDVSMPSGLLQQFETDDGVITVTHGHALKPSYWQRDNDPLRYEDGLHIWTELAHPSQELLDQISATTGSHRSDYLKAVAVGTVTKLMPQFVRQKVVDFLGQKYTREYEEYYAQLLAISRQQSGKNVMGVMGHTHVAGIRAYDGITILNTGTAGAKPNPLQRLTDPRAHMAIIDTEQGKYELVQTYSAAQPLAKPALIDRGYIGAQDVAHAIANTVVNNEYAMKIEAMSAMELYAAVGTRAEVLPRGHVLRLKYESFLWAMPTYTDEEASRENVFGPNKHKIASNVEVRQLAYIEEKREALKAILIQMVAKD